MGYDFYKDIAKMLRSSTFVFLQRAAPNTHPKSEGKKQIQGTSHVTPTTKAIGWRGSNSNLLRTSLATVKSNHLYPSPDWLYG